MEKNGNCLKLKIDPNNILREFDSPNNHDSFPKISSCKSSIFLRGKLIEDLTNFKKEKQKILDVTYSLSEKPQFCIRLIYHKTMAFHLENICANSTLTGCKTRESDCDLSRVKIIILTSYSLKGAMHSKIITRISNLCKEEKIGVIYHKINNYCQHDKNLFTASLKITFGKRKEESIKSDKTATQSENDKLDQIEKRKYVVAPKKKKEKDNLIFPIEFLYDMNKITEHLNNFGFHYNAEENEKVEVYVIPDDPKEEVTKIEKYSTKDDTDFI